MRGLNDSFRRLIKGVWAVVFSVAFSIGMACAQERLPNEPMVLKPGEWTVSKGAESKLLENAKFWTSFPMEKEQKDGTTRTRPSKDTSLGIHFLRVFVGDNITPWQTVLIDDLPLVVRKDRGNDTLAKALELKGAGILTGTVQASKSEFYKVKLAKGESFTVEVLAQRLFSKMDPMVRVLDERGRQLAFNEDEPGLGRDCRLRFTAKAEQTVIIEVRDSFYQGGDQYVYALRIGEIPQVNFVYTGAKGESIWFGPDAGGEKFSSAATQPGIAQWFAPRLAMGKPAALVTVASEVTDKVSEAEPNDQLAQANSVKVADTVFGRFEKTGDVDWFAWEVKKGEKFLVRAQTRSIGLPADVKLTAHGKEGKELAASKMAAEDEGGLDVTAAEDGKLFLRVSHLARLSGPEQGYRLNIRSAKTSFVATNETGKVVVAQDGTADLKVGVERLGYDEAIEFTLEPKVEGLTLSKSSIEAKKKEGTLQFKADASMVAGSIYQVRLESIKPLGGRVQTYPALTNQFGTGATLATTLDGWITVAIKAKAKEEAAEKPKSP